MKFAHVIIYILLFLNNSNLLAQIIYSQNFNAPTTLATSGWTSSNLTVPWGNGSFIGITNIWRVTDGESGRPPNVCGAANMGNQTLHIGASALASGAAYLSNALTNKRVSSPNINTTGYTNLQLSFNFIGSGEANDDKAYLQYSIDGGATWIDAIGPPSSTNPALPVGASLNNLKSNNAGCGGQGRWTNITWNLPASCENIPNLRIAFVWQNDNDANATDPSFAVDDIVISTTTPLGVELSYFGIDKLNSSNQLKWTTLSESNNSHFTIEKSINGFVFDNIGKVPGKGNTNYAVDYIFNDPNIQTGILYYRIKQVDYNGIYKYSEIISIERNQSEDVNVTVYPNGQIHLTFNSLTTNNIRIYINDILGRNVKNIFIQNISHNQEYTLYLQPLNQILILNIVSENNDELIFCKKILF